MSSDYNLTRMIISNQLSHPVPGPSDEVLAGSAEFALLCADGADFRRVGVDAVAGVLTLFGKVSTESEKRHAAFSVGELEGVRGVNNLLEVAPEAQAAYYSKRRDANSQVYQQQGAGS